MALIKSHNTQQHASQAVVLDLGDLRQQADAILARAHEQAELVLNQAQVKAKDIHEQAKQAGYDTGYELGKNEGHVEGEKQGMQKAHEEAKAICDQIQQAWIHAAEQWDAMRHDMISEAQQSLLKLAMLTAEKIVQRVQTTDPTLIQSQVNAALEYVVAPCAVTIHISPEDRPQLEALLPEMLNQLTSAEHVNLVEDASIQRGGCMVDYGRGRIDARIETQLEQMIQTLIPHQPIPEEVEAPSKDQATEAESQTTPSMEGPGSGSEPEQDKSTDTDKEAE